MSQHRVGVAWFPALFAAGILSVPVSAEELDARLEAAVEVYRKEGARLALPEFERLAQEFDRESQPRDAAAALHYVGESYWRLGDYPKARELLDQALRLEQQSGDRQSEAKTRNVLGLLEWDLGNYEQAQSNFRLANTIGRDVGDRKLEGASLNNLGLVLDELGEYDASLEHYQEVLRIYESANFPRGVGDTLGNIGGVHLLLGQFGEALTHYERALAISTDLQSAAAMSQDHGNIALCLLGLGEVDAAIAHFDQALMLARQAGMRQDEAYWQMGKGNALVQKGRYGDALKQQRAALAIYEAIGSQTELVEALHEMGRLHLLLGDPDTAEQYFRRAVELARAIELPRGVTLNLLSLGDLEFRRGQVLEATTLYEEAHTRAARAGEQQLLAASLLRSALAYRELDRLDDAGNAVRRALEIAQDTGARWIEAEALLASADLDRRRMRLEPALALYGEAESLLQPDLDPELLWQVHFGRAMALEAQGNLDAAIDALASAVAVIEGVRNQLAEPRFRAGYVEDKYEVYVELVRLQLQKGKKSDAFSTAERLRARSYAEQLRGRSTLPLSDEDRKTESQLRERIRQLQRVIAAEELGLDGAIRRPALARFSAELLLAEREYQAFLDDQRASRPVDSASDLFPTSAAVQARLRPHEALLEFVVGRASLVIFVMTERDLHATSVSVGRAQLEARVGLIRDLVQRPGNKQWKKPARSLAALLLDPIRSDDWLAGVQHLYIVPHGALNYLPFAALIETVGDVDRALVEQFTLTQLPAASALLNVRATTGGEALLAVAPSRSRLRYAPEEARSVDELFQPNSRLLLGASATESEFKNVAAEYGVLHIATHGYFNKLNPLLSGLELEPDASNDGLLEVFEVLGLRLRADLVTLSACDTALGSGYFSDVPPGDEIVGMTRAFLAAGSAAVLAALWEVDDRASVAVMQRFYEHMKRSEGRDKALALAQTQREFRNSREFSHPYYWAPFVLTGSTTHIIQDTTNVARLGQ